MRGNVFVVLQTVASSESQFVWPSNCFHAESRMIVLWSVRSALLYELCQDAYPFLLYSSLKMGKVFVKNSKLLLNLVRKCVSYESWMGEQYSQRVLLSHSSRLLTTTWIIFTAVFLSTHFKRNFRLNSSNQNRLPAFMTSSFRCRRLWKFLRIRLCTSLDFQTAKSILIIQCLSSVKDILSLNVHNESKFEIFKKNNK